MNLNKNSSIPKLELVEVEGEIVAEILRSSEEVLSSTFLSDSESSLQIGILAHQAGFVETAHFHPKQKRKDTETQQFIIVVRGEIEIDFFTRIGQFSSKANLKLLDSILIRCGVHRLRALDNSKCITIKQGPYIDFATDRTEVIVKGP
jgi:hypothetical protein